MWAFRFESWVAFRLLSGEGTMLEYLEMASTEPEDELREAGAMNESSRKAAATIYHLMAQMVAGRALGIIRRCPRGNGLLAWSRLKKEYEDDSGYRSVDLLMGVPNPKWVTTSVREGLASRWTSGRPTSIFTSGRPIRCWRGHCESRP